MKLRSPRKAQSVLSLFACFRFCENYIRWKKTIQLKTVRKMKHTSHTIKYGCVRVTQPPIKDMISSITKRVLK